MFLDRLVYFLTHPSEFLGLWTLDLTVATVGFSVVTLLVVLKQLSLMNEQTRLMRHQDTLMQQQTDIVVRQDETNREILSRRVKLVMYTELSLDGRVVVMCRNYGNKTAQNFFWHLEVPQSVQPAHVRDVPLDGRILDYTGMESHDGQQYRHYTGLVAIPLYPTRVTPVVRITTLDMKGGPPSRRTGLILRRMVRCSGWTIRNRLNHERESS